MELRTGPTIALRILPLGYASGSRRRPSDYKVFQIDVLTSASSTATVVVANRSVEFSPSGRNALPYWKYFIGQRSFCQRASKSQFPPSKLPNSVTSRLRLKSL